MNVSWWNQRRSARWRPTARLRLHHPLLTTAFESNLIRVYASFLEDEEREKRHLLWNRKLVATADAGSGEPKGSILLSNVFVVPVSGVAE